MTTESVLIQGDNFETGEPVEIEVDLGDPDIIVLPDGEPVTEVPRELPDLLKTAMSRYDLEKSP